VAVTRARSSLGVRLGVYLVGICGIGIGVSLMVEADLGVAPNDVMNTGLADTLGTQVGTAAWITAGIAMVLSWILGRRPRPATVLGGVVVGFAINAAIEAIATPDTLGVRILFLGAGLAVVWLSITGIVSADVGAGPLELLMLAFMDKGVSIAVARWGLEIGLLVIGLLLGGRAGLGTVLFAVLTGPVLAFTLPRATAALGTQLSQPTEIAAAGP
jgi:uncharacterized membrane protein YczE